MSRRDPWDMFPLGNRIATPSGVLVRREAFLGTGGWRRDFAGSADYHMWLILSLSSPIACVDRETSARRHHAGSQFRTMMARDPVGYLRRYGAAAEHAGHERLRLLDDPLRRAGMERRIDLARVLADLGEAALNRDGEGIVRLSARIEEVLRVTPPAMGRHLFALMDYTVCQESLDGRRPREVFRFLSSVWPRSNPLGWGALSDHSGNGGLSGVVRGQGAGSADVRREALETGPSRDAAPLPGRAMARQGDNPFLRVDPVAGIRATSPPGGRMRSMLVAIVRDEADFLDEWICYHWELGVDHVLIFDNGSSDGTSGVLRKYICHGMATVIDWPIRQGQRDAYTFALRAFGPVTEWMIFLDVDEFLVLDPQVGMARYLDGWSGSVGQILLPSKYIGYSGHRRRPKGLVIQNFWEEIRPPDGLSRNKQICRPCHVSRAGIHCSALKAGRTISPTGLPVEPSNVTLNPEFGSAHIRHYFTKSLADCRRRNRRWLAPSGLCYDRWIPPFRPDPPVGTPDAMLLALVDRVEERMRFMRGLHPSPSHNGELSRWHGMHWCKRFRWNCRDWLERDVLPILGVHQRDGGSLVEDAPCGSIFLTVPEFGGGRQVAAVRRAAHERLFKRIAARPVRRLADGRSQRRGSLHRFLTRGDQRRNYAILMWVRSDGVAKIEVEYMARGGSAPIVRKYRWRRSGHFLVVVPVIEDLACIDSFQLKNRKSIEGRAKLLDLTVFEWA